MTLTVLSRAGQVFCIMSLNWDLSDFPPLWLDQDYSFGRRTTGVKCHSHHTVASRVRATNTTYHGRCWPWPAVWGAICQASPCTAALFPLRSPLSSVEGGHYARYSPGGSGGLLHLFGGKNLPILFGILLHGRFFYSPPFICVFLYFIQSCIYINTGSWIFI